MRSKLGLSHYTKTKDIGGGHLPERFLNDEHQLAEMDGTLQLWEDPECDNCGWHCEPQHDWQKKRYVYCCRWKGLKKRGYSCKAWAREGHVSSEKPDWINDPKLSQVVR